MRDLLEAAGIYELAATSSLRVGDATVNVVAGQLEKEILESVFGNQSEIGSNVENPDIWTVVPVASDGLTNALEQAFTSLKSETIVDRVKRWGGDNEAERLRTGMNDWALIKHEFPFRGFTVFDKLGKLLVYVRSAADAINIPHFEHLTKYRLRTLLWASGPRVELHSATCIFRGHGIAFVGPRKAGKTTLAMNFLENGADFVGSDFVSLDTGWGATAVPHMCRIAPGTASASKTLRSLETRDCGPGEYLKGPVFFDSKYELYAAALDELFGRRVHATTAQLGAILLPEFEAGFDGFQLENLNREEGIEVIYRSIFEDRPLPDWLPFDEVLDRDNIMDLFSEALMGSAPTFAKLKFGATFSRHWQTFEAELQKRLI